MPSPASFDEPTTLEEIVKRIREILQPTFPFRKDGKGRFYTPLRITRGPLTSQQQEFVKFLLGERAKAIIRGRKEDESAKEDLGVVRITMLVLGQRGAGRMPSREDIRGFDGGTSSFWKIKFGEARIKKKRKPKG